MQVARNKTVRLARGRTALNHAGDSVNGPRISPIAMFAPTTAQTSRTRPRSIKITATTVAVDSIGW